MAFKQRHNNLEEGENKVERSDVTGVTKHVCARQNDGCLEFAGEE